MDSQRIRHHTFHIFAGLAASYYDYHTESFLAISYSVQSTPYYLVKVRI
jgi:Zn-dependent oligopeptidase